MVGIKSIMWWQITVVWSIYDNGNEGGYTVIDVGISQFVQA